MVEMLTAESGSLDRHLYEELADDLAMLIDQGTLRTGDRLPSVRRLSRQRGVSVSTVLQAYLQLESRGVVETRPQSGHYVPRRASRRSPPSRARHASAARRRA